jgi:hypothetical protein
MCTLSRFVAETLNYNKTFSFAGLRNTIFAYSQKDYCGTICASQCYVTLSVDVAVAQAHGVIDAQPASTRQSRLLHRCRDILGVFRLHFSQFLALILALVFDHPENSQPGTPIPSQ